MSRHPNVYLAAVVFAITGFLFLIALLADDAGTPQPMTPATDAPPVEFQPRSASGEVGRG